MSISNKHGNTLSPLNKANIPVRTRVCILLCPMVEIGDALFSDCWATVANMQSIPILLSARVCVFSLPAVVRALSYRFLQGYYTILDRYSTACTVYVITTSLGCKHFRLYTLWTFLFFLVLRIYNFFCVCPCLRCFTLQFAHSDSVVDHPSGRRLLYTTYAIVVNQLLLCLSSAYSRCPDSLLFNVCMLFCVRLRVGLVPIQSMRGCWAHVYSVFSFTEWWWWWRGAYYSSSSVCTALRRRVLSCLSFRVSLHRGHCDHYRRLLCKPSRSLLLHHCAINFFGHGSSYFSTSVTWTWTFPYLSYLFHSWARYLLIACVHVWASVSLVVREPPTWFGRRLPHLIWSRIVRCLFISQGE